VSRLADGLDEGVPCASLTGPVLVGVDGSAGATRAVGVAAELARALQAELAVVHAVGMTAHVDGELVPAEGHLDEIERELRSEWCRAVPDDIRWQAVLEYGTPADVLTRLAAERGAALVVVGARGVGEASPSLLGSTSHHVVHHCDRPVVVVPAHADKET